MISTVTISTVTTVIAATSMGLTAAIGAIAVASLIVFLTTRELAGASGSSGKSVRIARFLSVGVLPLMIAFAAIVGVKIAAMF